MRDEVISNHLAVLHHEPNAFQLGDVGDRITGDRYQIGEFSRLDRIRCGPASPAFLRH